MIDGVRVIPLKRIPDERGTVMHMLKRTDPHFVEFGEIYFSSIYRDAIKGWHLHKLMSLNYACVAGRIKMVIYDDREGSATRGQLMEIFLGRDNYALVHVPPNLWNGFKGLAEESIVANCASHPHDPTQSLRMDPLRSPIPYDWAIKHQ